MLCTELPTLENGRAEKEPLPDGGTGIAVTYTLKQGLSWADGEPLTAADVRFSWQVGRHPKTGTISQQIYDRIRDVEVHGPRRFTVHWDRVTYDYNAFALPILPEHLERAKFESDPADYRKRTTFDTDTTNPGLYFGPYRMTHMQRGARVVYERNPHWQGKRPEFDRIVVRTIANTAAMEANLLSGNIDMIAGESGISLDQALALERRRGDDFQFRYQPGLFYEHIEFNLDDPIVGDRRVRRALAYGANRRAISEQLFAGKQPVALHNVNPRDRVFTDDVRHYPHDPEKARALLDAAGWDELRDGVRHNDAGAPLRVTIMTTAGNRTRELVQQVLQSDWAEIGVELQIVNEPPRVFFGQTVSGREFDQMAMFAWLSSPQSVPRSTLHSSMIPTEEAPHAGQNFTGYSNDRVDTLLDRIETELDPGRRTELWHELLRIYARDLPSLPLYWRAQPFVLPQWLAGVEPTGHQYPTTFWVEDWRVDAGPAG
jgi:peptide/nickel transport system substrate-binding protein